MRRALRGMGPAIHVDNPLSKHEPQRGVPVHHRLRERIDLRTDSHVGGSTRRIIRRMRLAFVLDHLPLLRVPCVRPHAGRIIDGDAGVIADFGSAEPFGKIFVHLLGPLAGQINLSDCGAAEQS